MRMIGLDVGRRYVHAAVVEPGSPARPLGRFQVGDELHAFAASLGPTDTVALEASTTTWAIVELLGRHAGQVVVSNPLRTRAIADAKRKTDTIDAATLAELLAADYLPTVWIPDPATRQLRRLVAHRAGLVHDRTANRNRAAAILARQLLRAPVSDAFGVAGRAWLAALDLPPDERLALDAVLRIEAALGAEIERADQAIAEVVVDDGRMHRLLTIPGIGLVTAAGILALVGDISRFPRPANLVSYLGLDPRVRQSGDRPARGGHISRAGQGHARGLLTEAAHAAARTPGPLATFFVRLRARRGPGIATVATARKLAILVWHLLTKEEDYRGADPTRVAPKRRRLEQLAGRQPERTRPSQRGATAMGPSGAGLRGRDDPLDPALRQAIGHVRTEPTPANGP
jgi:transposase